MGSSFAQVHKNIAARVLLSSLRALLLLWSALLTTALSNLQLILLLFSHQHPLGSLHSIAVNGSLKVGHGTPNNTLSLLGQLLQHLVLSTTKDERGHHPLGTRDTRVGQKANLRSRLNLEDGTERLADVIEHYRENEVHERLRPKSEFQVPAENAIRTNHKLL